MPHHIRHGAGAARHRPPATRPRRPSPAYLDLPNGIVSSRPSLTFETWLTPLSSKNWQRIFDFGRGSMTSGTGAAAGRNHRRCERSRRHDQLRRPVALAQQWRCARQPSTRRRFSTMARSPPRTPTFRRTTTDRHASIHYVLAVARRRWRLRLRTACQAKWYRNGSVAGQRGSPLSASDLQDVNNWIGRSMWSADTNSNIAINELRGSTTAPSPSSEVLASLRCRIEHHLSPAGTSRTAPRFIRIKRCSSMCWQNDTGTPIASSLQILAPPATGTATVDCRENPLHSQRQQRRAGHVHLSRRERERLHGGWHGDHQLRHALRLTNASLAMPAAPPVNAWQLVDALPGLTFTQPHLPSRSVPGNTKRLFVCERMAKIKHVPDVTAATPTKNVFLDLQTVVAGRTPAETHRGRGQRRTRPARARLPSELRDQRLLLRRLHRAHQRGSYYQRISRFKVSATDPTVADPTSEQILPPSARRRLEPRRRRPPLRPRRRLPLLRRRRRGEPERLPAQQPEDQQGLLRRRLPDRRGQEARQPRAKPACLHPDRCSGVARFSVPVDNPFVHTTLGGTWNGTYNGVAITPLQRRAHASSGPPALRHVWRMSFDSGHRRPLGRRRRPGHLRGSEQDRQRRQLRLGLSRGQTRHRLHQSRCHRQARRLHQHRSDLRIRRTPASPAATRSSRVTPSSVATSIAARRFPSLVGTYIFSDSVSGHVWQMDTTTGATVRLTGLPGAYGVFSAQGVDPSNRTCFSPPTSQGKSCGSPPAAARTNGFPTTLSATGLFADLTDLSPSPGLLPYQPNLTFWSDHAIKRRWFTIPDATGQMTWSKDGNWTYPDRHGLGETLRSRTHPRQSRDQETHRDPRPREDRHRLLRRQLPLERRADRGHARRRRRRASSTSPSTTTAPPQHAALADPEPLELPHLPHAAGRATPLLHHPPAQSRLHHQRLPGNQLDAALQITASSTTAPDPVAILARHVAREETQLSARTTRPLLFRRQLLLLPPDRRQRRAASGTAAPT